MLECGGTSSNVSVVKGGRTVLRTLRVMGRPTAIRSVDSWVVGAAGGSMARVGRRRLDEVGPRSAHVAGLPYACYAPAGTFGGARLALLAPRPGDPEYAAVQAGDGTRYALTATCAAQRWRVEAGARQAARGRARRVRAARRADAARARAGRPRVLDGAVAKIAQAVAEAAKAPRLRARRCRSSRSAAPGPRWRPRSRARSAARCLAPEHPEILSSIGAALSLVRAEVARHGSGPGGDASRCRARPSARAWTPARRRRRVRVETRFEAREGILRAVATGAVALESGAAGREPVGERRAAARGRRRARRARR